MTSAKCLAYPLFYSDHNAKFLFIFLSENVCEKLIVTQGFCVSNNSNNSSFCPVENWKNCKIHSVLIRSSLDQTLRRIEKYHFTYQIVDCIFIRRYGSSSTSSTLVFVSPPNFFSELFCCFTSFANGLSLLTSTNNFPNLWSSDFKQIRRNSFRSWDYIFFLKKELQFSQYFVHKH